MAKMVNSEVEVVRFENEDVVALSYGRKLSLGYYGLQLYGGGTYSYSPVTTHYSGAKNSLGGLIGEMNSAYGIPTNTSANNIILQYQTTSGGIVDQTLQQVWDDLANNGTPQTKNYTFQWEDQGNYILKTSLIILINKFMNKLKTAYADVLYRMSGFSISVRTKRPAVDQLLEETAI